MNRAEHGPPPHRERFRLDLTSVLVAIVVIAVALLLTFELWNPHGYPH